MSNIIKDLISGGAKGIFEGVSKVVSNFKADPTKVAEFDAELKQLEVASELEMARIANEAEKIKQEELRIEVEAEKARLLDVANARETNVKIQESDKASWMAKNIPYLIAINATIVWSVVTIYLVCKAIKVVNDNADMTSVLSLYTTITAVFMIILNYYFGSSASSDRKQKQLDKMLTK